MRGRALRIFIACFWFFWTAIFIPGHTRGAIAVDGKQAIGTCCRDADGKPQPTKSTSSCAVCNLAAKLMPASTLSIRLDPGELLEIRPLAPTAAPAVVRCVLTLQSRAPPTAS